MNVILNGNPQEFPAPLPIRGLLQHLGLGEKPVVVELNLRAIFPREFPTTMVHEGDRLEIVQITAGG